MATRSLHFRLIGEPMEFIYTGKIVGYGSNTILVEYDENGDNPIGQGEFMEVYTFGSDVTQEGWSTVWSNDITAILKRNTMEPRETLVAETSKTPVRSKPSELDR